MSSAPAATKLPRAKSEQAEDDHRLAPETIGRGAIGNLQAGLGEAVGAERQADQRDVVARRQMRWHRAKKPAGSGTGRACARQKPPPG
jgi:hypothetical protein